MREGIDTVERSESNIEYYYVCLSFLSAYGCSALKHMLETLVHIHTVGFAAHIYIY